MNILHHKSWHVRNKRNIERVRRDEQKAREEEEAKDKRKELAESEARISLLRTRAKTGNPNQKDVATLDQITSIFGEEEPSAIGDDRRNLDHEVEAKKEKEEWEKKMGILTYLGQGLNDPGIEKPWYLMDHDKRMKLEPEEPRFDRQPALSSSTSTFNAPVQSKNDPLLDMQRYMDVIKQSKSKRETHQSDYCRAKPLETHGSKTPEESSKSRHKKRKKEKKSLKKKKHRKHKKHKAHSKKKNGSDDSSTSAENDSDPEVVVDNSKSLEALRAERLRREKAERERAMQLLNKTVKPEPVVEIDERRRTYNSQFNPHLAKQNQDPTE